jgi:predicted secreted acid phosphatase
MCGKCGANPRGQSGFNDIAVFLGLMRAIARIEPARRSGFVVGMKIKPPRLMLILLMALLACRAEPRNLSVLKQEIVAYVDSGEYERELKGAVEPALKFLTERVARKTPTERLVMVLDIDETALSNLPHMRAIDFGYIPVEWDAWVARGEASVIAPVLALFQAARKADVEVVFITGRKESDRPGTEKNLRAAGFGDYASLWLKPNGAKLTTEKFKTETRRKIEAAGKVIIINVGDQISDVTGGFSEQAIKLPGPFYQTQ